jgi:hypothetical protein
MATVDVAHEARSSRIGPRTDGADLRVTIGEPLRLAILVGRDPANVAAAYAVALGANADVVLVQNTAGTGTLIDRAVALRDVAPHAVLVVADKGDAAGMVELVEALRLGCGAGPRPPALLVAAEESMRGRIAASASPMQQEAIPDPTKARSREAIVARLRGLRRGGGEVVLRDEAIEAAAQSLAAASGRSTLVLDVSGASTSCVLVQSSGMTAAHSRLGIGSGADRVVAGTGLDRVRRWIPRPIDGPALLERVFNRARWPDAVAPSVLTLALEMSLAREALAHVVREAQRAGLDVAALRSAQRIVATGALARFPRPAQTALVAIDALAPEGTQLVSRENPDALVVAGAVATRSGAADLAGTTEDLALVTTLSPKRTTSITVTDQTGSIEERIAPGAFFLLPTTGAVQLGFSGLPARGGARARHTAESLALGVIVDARGRPLELPPRDAERLPTIARWYSAVAGLPIDEGAL